MNQSSRTNSNALHAIEVLSEKIFKEVGFSRGQQVSWDNRGDRESGTVYDVKLEVREEGAPVGTEFSVSLGDLPLVELLNKAHEETNSPFPVGTVVTLSVSVPASNYRIPPGKRTIRCVVTGLLVGAVDYRLRGYDFLPHELTVESALNVSGQWGGYNKRKSTKKRRGSRRYSRRN